MSCLLYYLGILNTFMLGNTAHCQGATPHLSQLPGPQAGMYLQNQQSETLHLRLNICGQCHHQPETCPEADDCDFFPQSGCGFGPFES